MKITIILKFKLNLISNDLPLLKLIIILLTAVVLLTAILLKFILHDLKSFRPLWTISDPAEIIHAGVAFLAYLTVAFICELWGLYSVCLSRTQSWLLFDFEVAAFFVGAKSKRPSRQPLSNVLLWDLNTSKSILTEMLSCKSKITSPNDVKSEIFQQNSNYLSLWIQPCEKQVNKVQSIGSEELLLSAASLFKNSTIWRRPPWVIKSCDSAVQSRRSQLAAANPWSLQWKEAFRTQKARRKICLSLSCSNKK